MTQYKFTDKEDCGLYVTVYDDYYNDEDPSIVFDSDLTLVNLERKEIQVLSNILNTFLKDTESKKYDNEENLMTKQTPSNTYNKSEQFDWIVDNNASIVRHPFVKWENEDGNVFYSNFTLCAHDTQYPPFPTLEEAIDFAMNYKD